jgi:hypothetical protein
MFLISSRPFGSVPENWNREILKNLVLLVFIFGCGRITGESVRLEAPPKITKKLIILSIDGFPAYYLDSKDVRKEIPNLDYFFRRSVGGRVRTVDPSLTYPAHTSMITGKDPGKHGIEGNTPVDPFQREEGAWEWYYEDIRIPTLVDYAIEKNLRTGSVFWPVSVGSKAAYLIPQIWRSKTEEDYKLLRALSTPGLFDQMHEFVGLPVSEITGDSPKIKTGAKIFNLYQTDLLLVYSTDLDTVHHGKGPFSPEAIRKLKEIDTLFGEFLNEIGFYQQTNLGLILVSDHGFLEASKVCRPNLYLQKHRWIKPNKKDWKYYFKSAGGIAHLVENPKASQIEWKSKRPDFRLWKKDLERACPGTRFRFEGEDWKTRKEKSHPDSLAFLEGDSKTLISSGFSGRMYSKGNSIFTHGFSSGIAKMDTILFANFGPNTAEFMGGFRSGVYGVGQGNSRSGDLQSIKDVFALGCLWLGLECGTQIPK